MVTAPQCRCLAYESALPRLCAALLAPFKWESAELTQSTISANVALILQSCCGRLAVSWAWGALIAIKRACHVALIAAVAWPTGLTRASASAPKTPVGI